MVDFSEKNTALSIEVYAFNRVSLCFAAACTHGGRLHDHSPIDFDLTLHNVTGFEDRRLQVLRDMFKLHATEAYCVAVFEPERDILELRNLLYVESV